MNEIGVDRGWHERLARRMAVAAARPEWPGSLWLRVSLPGETPFLGAIPAQDDYGRTPVDRRPFRIASVTKVHVAAATWRLIERGDLRLDMSIDKLLAAPTVSALGAAGYDPAAIELVHLLQHTSGLPDHSSSERFLASLVATPRHVWSPRQQLDIALAESGPLSSPGSTFHYSDTGYVLVGSIVERASRLPLHAALRTLLAFDRLRLNFTWFDDHEKAPTGAGPLARQLMGAIDAETFHPTFDLFGGGGLVSTLCDMERFLRALYGGEAFELPSTIECIAATPAVDCGFEGFTHDSVCFKTRRHGVEIHGHTGFWGVIAAHAPAIGMTLTATFNRSREPGFYDADALLTDVVAALLEDADATPSRS